MSAISRLIRTGVLEPVTLRPQRFHIQDVNEVRKMVQDKVHISKIWNHAFLAHQGVRHLEKKLNTLLEMLQVTSSILPTGEIEVRALFKKIYKTSRSRPILTAEEVMDWAKIFLAIDENYLVLAAGHLKTSEPWQQVLWFSQHLLETAPTELFPADKGLEAAYHYLSYAHRHLRQVSYFYCRVLHGAKEAGRCIPEAQSGDTTNEISAIVAAMLNNESATRRKKKEINLDKRRHSSH